MMHHADTFLSRTRLERRYAANALHHWGMTGARLTLIKCETTALFRVDASDGNRYVLRLHPPHRHPKARIESELIFLRTLHEHSSVHALVPVPTRDGSLLVEATLADEDEPRRCALFTWVSGQHKRKLMTNDAQRLGETIARLHNVSQQFGRPDGFARWDFDEDTFADIAQEIETHGPARYDTDDMRLLRDAIALSQAGMRALGKDKASYGLIHADTNLSNFKFDGSNIGIVDFEVCCYGFYLFDVGRALEEMLDLPNARDVQYAFHAGYATHRALPSLDDECIRAFIAMNLVDFLAWVLSNERQLSAERLARDSAMWLRRLRAAIQV